MIDSAQQVAQPKAVLIIKPSALGDVVSAVPVLRGLRRTFPKARISWLVSDACSPLIQHDSQLDEAILFRRRMLGKWWRSPRATRELIALIAKLRGDNFDWVIDLQGLLRSALMTALTRAPVKAGFADAREKAPVFYTHRIEVGEIHTVDRNIALARRLGIDAREKDFKLQRTIAGRRFVTAFCRKHKAEGIRRGGFIVCAPTTTWPTKVYPARHWRKVVTELSRRLPVVLVASPTHRQFCRQISDGLGEAVLDLTGQTTVDEMVALIAASAGVICCDSAAKFIAPSVGIDCVTLIGPTRTDLTGPYLRGRSIVAEVPCQGCLRRRCGHITCMQMIDPVDVVSAAEQMLDGNSR